MYGSVDVARGEYDNTEVEAIRGNFARKSHNKNSRITWHQWLQWPCQILANNEHDIISQIQLLDEYPGTAAHVPGAQGECQNYHQKFPKSEKQHLHRSTYGTYNSTTVTNKTHGQNKQI
jgi:hypothetical protein